MTKARVKVTLTFFADIDTADYPDPDWEPNQDGEEDDETEEDRPELSLSEAIAAFREEVIDDPEQAISESDEIDDVKVEQVD